MPRGRRGRSRREIFNVDYCSNKKRTNIFTNENYIYNFKVDFINLYTSGKTSLENVKYKDNLQAGKTYILGNDIDFKSSTPNVYKSHNCEWTTKFKDQEITSSFKPFNKALPTNPNPIIPIFIIFLMEAESGIEPE